MTGLIQAKDKLFDKPFCKYLFTYKLSDIFCCTKKQQLDAWIRINGN